MKKLLSILTTLMIITSCATNVFSAQVGRVIGQALNTDIVAYINNYAIPSYAVNGTSVIVAEDLRNFGFNVDWNPSSRSLNISRNYYNSTPSEMNFSKTGATGSKFADILSTDIVVWANGVRLTSYAINGYTMIPIEELTMFGTTNWVQSERAIKLWIDGLYIRPTMQSIAINGSSYGTATAALKQYAKNNLSTLYCSEFGTKYYDVRFMFADFSGDNIPELVAMGMYDGEPNYMEIYYYKNGYVSRIYNHHCEGANGSASNVVNFKGDAYVWNDNYSSGTGFLQQLMRFDGNEWVAYQYSYTVFDWNRGGDFAGYIVNNNYVSATQYENFNNEIANSTYSAYNFVSAYSL